MRTKPIYRISLWIALITSLGILWVLSSRILIQPRWIMKQDFAQFWAAGRLNLSGLNPYDPGQVQSVKEQIAGEAERKPQVVTIFYSPPWAILLSMPFALLAFLPSRLVWLGLNIILLLLSARILWQLYGGSERTRWMSWLVVFTFGPTYLVLAQGQITPLVLLGIVGFLFFIYRVKNDWLAGLCVFLISLKPQLLYLFWFALVLWIIENRRWKIIVGILLSILAALSASLIPNPQLVTQYIEAFVYFSPKEWITPTIGAMLRLVFGQEKFWLQFISPVIGLLWFAWYWRRHRARWDWIAEMPILIFISLITTSYAWTYDHILIIVALVPAWIALIEYGNRRYTALFLSLLLLINLVYTILHRFFADEYFIWLAPVLLIWWYIVMKITTDGQRRKSITEGI
jgi:hypothetical protein